MSATPAILAERLVKRYPVFRGFRDLVRRPFDRRTVTALDGLDLRVETGRVFCLLGPNGAGKTTLIKILATLVLPDGGRAAAGGHDVARDPARAKSAVGYAVGEERSFYWRLTGRENLELFAALIDHAGTYVIPEEGIAPAVFHRKILSGFSCFFSALRSRVSSVCW